MAGGRPADNTKAFFGETIANPKNDIFDIEGVADVAHDDGVPLIIDNTVPTPYLIRPLEWGADIVVHSADQVHRRPRHLDRRRRSSTAASSTSARPAASPASPSPTRATTAWPTGRRSAPGSYIIKARVQLLRDIGAPISPFNAFLILQGIETLSLRMERHYANAQKVAEYLVGQGQVLSVNYAGLPDSRWHERAQEATAAARASARCWRSSSRAAWKPASASSRRSSCTATWPTSATCAASSSTRRSTTHSQLTPEEQLATGVHPGLVRLSVGIETIDDILADLDKGFAAAKS